MARQHRKIAAVYMFNKVEKQSDWKTLCLYTSLVITFDVFGTDIHVQVFSTHSLVQTQQVITVALKVRGGIKRRRNVALVIVSLRDRFKGRADAGETLEDWSHQLKTGCHILIRSALLDNGRDNGNVNARSGNCKGVSNAAHKDVVDTAHLGSRNDDLDGFTVVRVGDGVVEDADASDQDAGRLDLLRREVRRVSNDHAGLGHLVACLNSAGFALVVVQDLVNVLVEREGSSVNGTDTGESFGKTTQSVNGVNVGAGSVTRQGIAVGLEILDGGCGGGFHVVLIEFEAHGVGDELVCVGQESKVLVELSHGHFA